MNCLPDEYDLANRKPFPAEFAVIPFFRSYSSAEFLSFKNGCYPGNMDDTWFLYFEKDRLNFYRAQSGFCIFTMQFKQARDDLFILTEVLVNRNKDQYRKNFLSYDLLLLVHVIEKLIFKREDKVDICDNLAISESRLFLRALKLLMTSVLRCHGEIDYAAHGFCERLVLYLKFVCNDLMFLIKGFFDVKR